MSQQQRLVLAAAGVVLMGLLAVIFGEQGKPETAAGASTPWLAGLKADLGTITRLRFSQGKSVSTLVRQGENWGVSERGGYGVDRERLGDLLKELAAARAVEQKTSKPEFFARLGLRDADKEGSTAVLVEIWRDADAPAWRVLIGNAAEGRGGRYLRLADSNETWLVDRSPQAFAEPTDWIDRRILNLEFDGVERVIRTLADGSGFEAARSAKDQPSLSVASLPKGAKPRYDSVFDAAARAVLTAEAEDVRKADTGLFSGPALAGNRIRFFDGLVLDIDAVKATDGNWIRVMASAAPTAAAESAAAAQAALPPTAPAAQASAINARIEGWAFKVSDYIYGELAKPLKEYTEAEKAEAGKADDTTP